MSVKLKEEKPTTSSSSIVGCCQSSNTTPENSIIDYIGEDLETKNAINLSEVITKKKPIDFTFPKRPKVDIEFKNIKYIVKEFTFQERKFGKCI